jgi:iron-sulfur cluster assembly accessory protein
VNELGTITISELAAQKLKELIEEEGKADAALRIGFAAGGAGYSLSLDGETNEDDVVVHSNGVQIVVDQESLPMLDGSEIDYMEGLQRSGFVINNPNTQSGGGCCGGGGSCGCGAQ